MKSIHLLNLLAIIIFSSCAKPKPDITLEDDILLFAHPPLAIKLKKEIGEVEKEGLPKKITFADPNVSPIFIEFSQTSTTNTFDFYYNLPYIAANNNMLYIGPVYFGDKEWAKVINVDADGFLLFGYFTLKENHFVYIYMYEGLNERGVRTFMQYKNTRKIPDRALAFINAKFDYFGEFATILY